MDATEDVTPQEVDEVQLSCDQYKQILDLKEIRDNGLLEIEGSVEGLLTRLDEFGEHLDYIHVSTSNISGKVLPQLLMTSKNLEFLFKKVDCVQEYVNYVSGRVKALEAKVAEMEKIQSQEKLNKYIPKFLKRGNDAPQQFLFSSTDYFVSPIILTNNMKRLVEERRQNETITSEPQTPTSEAPEPVDTQEESIVVDDTPGEEAQGEEEEGEEQEVQEVQGEEEEGEEEEGEEEEN